MDIRDVEELQRIGGMLGRKVQTPDGKGVLIGVEVQSNGLYVECTRNTVTVWYGTGNPDNGGWVQRSYSAREVKLIKGDEL